MPLPCVAGRKSVRLEVALVQLPITPAGLAPLGLTDVVHGAERRLAVEVVAHTVIAWLQRKESAKPKDVAEHKNCNHRE